MVLSQADAIALDDFHTYVVDIQTSRNRQTMGVPRSLKSHLLTYDLVSIVSAAYNIWSTPGFPTGRKD